MKRGLEESRPRASMIRSEFFCCDIAAKPECVSPGVSRGTAYARRRFKRVGDNDPLPSGLLDGECARRQLCGNRKIDHIVAYVSRCVNRIRVQLIGSTGYFYDPAIVRGLAAQLWIQSPPPCEEAPIGKYE